jgi:hypothetical protein
MMNKFFIVVLTLALLASLALNAIAIHAYEQSRGDVWACEIGVRLLKSNSKVENPQLSIDRLYWHTIGLKDKAAGLETEKILIEAYSPYLKN